MKYSFSTFSDTRYNRHYEDKEIQNLVPAFRWVTTELENSTPWKIKSKIKNKVRFKWNIL